MMGRLYVLFEQNQLLDAIPREPFRHLRWGKIMADRHKASVVRELVSLRDSLVDLDEPVIVLKGAAYSGSGLGAGAGRLFSDIDILVPKAVLDGAEELLQMDGWYTTHLDAYDQRYYRRWMHELPPMRHGKRGTELDVHHNILPETAVVTPDAGLLFGRKVPLPEVDGLWRLGDEDLVLHSASHLFFDGEFTSALRDLDDINSLLKELCLLADRWSGLLGRAGELGLQYPLYLALYYCREWFALPVPDSVMAEARSQLPFGNLRLQFGLWTMNRGLLPDHESCSLYGSGLARWMLYVRSHYLKMPLRLLVPHLLHKALAPRFEHLFKSDDSTPRTVDEFLNQLGREKRV
ncbi:hypothetical protein GSF27_01470 [Pseudomaricurvus sp. HS19]|nr:hypothetical protein [Pseudomaricurvus sp. HS19]